MKIVIIRHGKVDMEWDRYYDSVSFDKACSIYDISPIRLSNTRYENKNNDKIYISGLSRTSETARMLFGDNDFYKSELLNEVPLRSFTDTIRKLPLIIWNVIGRLQWLFNNKRQPETRSQTIDRAEKAISMLEKENADCIVVTHACFANTFTKQLKKRGNKIDKRKFRMNNLERVTAYK